MDAMGRGLHILFCIQRAHLRPGNIIGTTRNSHLTTEGVREVFTCLKSERNNLSENRTRSHTQTANVSEMIPRQEKNPNLQQSYQRAHQERLSQ